MKKFNELPKVLLLGKIPPPYMGPSIATEIILNSSLRRDFNLIHLDTRLNKNLTDIGKAGIGKALRLLKQYLKCFFILLFKKPDLMLVPISQSAAGYKKDAVFITLGRMLGIPTLVHLRGSNFLNFYKECPVKLQKKIQGDLQYVAGAIVLGEKLRNIFQPFLPDDKIFVVPNGANYSINSTDKQPIPLVAGELCESKINSSTNHEFKLIYLGNLQPSKGILDVIQAYTRLNTSTDTQLNIAGKWRDDKTREEVFRILYGAGFKPLQSSSSQYIHTSSHKHITFHSVLHGQSKINLLASCDLMLFPPREPEGHPWVIVEAMAAGLPIIATDQGAITESVIDGENGYIVEANSPEQIQKKIAYLIESPEQLALMGAQSQQFYKEKFTEECMVENLAKVFGLVIGFRPG